MNKADELMSNSANVPSSQPPPVPADSQVGGVQYSVSFGEALKNFWTRWTFAGRASRSEYWKPFLINAIIGNVFYSLALTGEQGAKIGGILYTVFALAVLIPGICISVRRMHDIGKSGWAYWINLIPFIGNIIFFIWLCKASEFQNNLYGPVPNVK